MALTTFTECLLSTKNSTVSNPYQCGRLIYLKSNHNHPQYFYCSLYVFYKVVRLPSTWRRPGRLSVAQGPEPAPSSPTRSFEMMASMQATIFSPATAHIPPSSGNSPPSRSHLTIILASSTPRSPRPLTRLIKQGRCLKVLIRKIRNGGLGP
jgi:hypothetical protein